MIVLDPSLLQCTVNSHFVVPYLILCSRKIVLDPRIKDPSTLLPLNTVVGAAT